MTGADRIAREIYEMRELARGHATAPQIANTAIDGGYIPIYDEDGNSVGAIATDSGALVLENTVTPKPPQPTAPIAEAEASLVVAKWDGHFEGEEVAPAYLDVVELHISADENFVPDRVESFKGAFASREGGTLTVGPMPDPGTYYVRLVARSSSGAFSVPSELTEVEVAFTSIDGAINDAQLSADGKNVVTYSDVPPTPADEGAVGDTWWVGSVADPENPVWLITEQWRLTEAGWAQVEMTHEVIATIDAGKITVGELDGIRIKARTITGDILAVDAIDGKTIIGATIKTAAQGARVELTQNGLKQYNANGQVITDMTGGSLSMVGVLSQENAIAKMEVGTGGVLGDLAPGIRWSGGDFAGQANPPMITVQKLGMEGGGPTDPESGPGLLIRGPDGSSSAEFGVTYSRLWGGSPLSDGSGIDKAQPYSWQYLGTGALYSGNAQGGGSARRSGLTVSSAAGGSASLVRYSTESKAGWVSVDDTGARLTHQISATMSNYVSATDSEVRVNRDMSGSSSSFLRMTASGNYLTWSHPTNSGFASMQLEDRSAWMGSYDSTGKAVGFLDMSTAASVLSANTRRLELWGGGGTELMLSSDSTGQRVYSMAIYNRKYGSSNPVMRITSAGTLGTDNSARRFKVDEKVFSAEDYADRLLSVPYKSWVSKEELRMHEEYLEFRRETPFGPVPEALCEAPQGPPLRDVGLVAEDLADAGLEEFVQRDEYGQTQGVAYDRIGAALIPIVGELRDRIEELEARLAAA